MSKLLRKETELIKSGSKYSERFYLKKQNWKFVFYFSIYKKLF